MQPTVQNGEYIVTASFDKTARVWTAAGELIATLAGHESSVSYAAYSPNGEYIVTASFDKTARVWTAAGEPIATLEDVNTPWNATISAWIQASSPMAGREVLTDGMMHAAYSPDGERIVTASLDGTARVWTAAGEPIATLEGHEGRVSRIAYSPNGERIVTASSDGTARVWTAAGEIIATFEGHEGRVIHAAYSPDGEHIVTASSDGTARVWSMQTLDQLVAKGCNWLQISHDYGNSISPSALEACKIP